MNAFASDSSIIIKNQSDHISNVIQQAGDLENMGIELFPCLQKVQLPVFDKQKIEDILEEPKSFDTQNSTQKTPITSVVESVSHNTTTLTSKAFIDPKKHHTDIGRSL